MGGENNTFPVPNQAYVTKEELGKLIKERVLQYDVLFEMAFEIIDIIDGHLQMTALDESAKLVIAEKIHQYFETERKKQENT